MGGMIRFAGRAGVGAVLVAASLFYACVGDDPATSAGANDAAPPPAPPPTPSDAAASDSAPADAQADAGPACNLAAPFGAPENVSELNTASNDVAARLTADRLTVFVSSNVSGAYGLYVAKRTSATGAFASLSQLDAGLGSGDTLTPFVTGNGATVYVGANPAGHGNLGGLDIFSMSPTATGAQDITALNSTGDEYGPWLLADDSAVFFQANRDGGLGAEDLWTAPIVGGNFGSPSPVPNVNTADYDNNPALTADGLTLYFVSTRGDHVHDQIYVTTRPSRSAPFITPLLVSELAPSSTAQWGVPWISPDGCEIYFVSTYAYPNAKGGYDIYRARKP